MYLIFAWFPVSSSWNNFTSLKIFNTVILLHFFPKGYLFGEHIKSEIIHICMNVHSECESAKHVMSISSIHYIPPLSKYDTHQQLKLPRVCLFLLLGTIICFYSFLLSPWYLPFTIFFLCGHFLCIVSEHNIFVTLLCQKIISNIELDYSVNADFLESYSMYFIWVLIRS